MNVSKENEKFLSGGVLPAKYFSSVFSYHADGTGEVTHAFSNSSRKTYLLEVHNQVPDKLLIVTSSYDPVESAMRSAGDIVISSIFGNGLSEASDIIGQLHDWSGGKAATAIVENAKRAAARVCEKNSESSARKIACQNAIDAVYIPELLSMSSQYWCEND